MFVDKLPVPVSHESLKTIFGHLTSYVLQLADKHLQLQSGFFEQLINAFVYELYFPDELNAANKQFLSHLGELQPLSDKMSEEEKAIIIQQQFDRLNASQHPIRQNLDTLNEVEVVRTIREALS